MFLEKLEIFNFRNIQILEKEFRNHVVIFEGLNGQGKTNVVEAIYFLSKGKSFRTSNYEHLVNKKNEITGCGVKGRINNSGETSLFEIKLENKKKEHKINEKRTESLKAFKKFPVIIFSPESLSIIKEGSEARRNIIDETLVLEDEDNVKLISQFKKAQKTKQQVIKKFKLGELSFNQSMDILGSLQPIFYQCSQELTKKRQTLIKNIDSLLKDTFREIQNRNVEISVGYVASQAETTHNTQAETIEKELSSGQILHGAHKDDISFSFENQDSRYYCSQGQQRALILAFKFTQILYHRAIYGYYPILILDDVLSEFDKEKRSFLIQFLNKKEAQTFITTTDLEEFKNSRSMDMNVLKIFNGAIKN